MFDTSCYAIFQLIEVCGTSTAHIRFYVPKEKKRMAWDEEIKEIKSYVNTSFLLYCLWNVLVRTVALLFQYGVGLYLT